jgi:hypothetical protein
MSFQIGTALISNGPASDDKYFVNARLSATKDELSLVCGARVFQFAPHEVRSIQTFRAKNRVALPLGSGGATSKGLQIVHGVSGHPSTLVFFAGHLFRIIPALRALGYVVNSQIKRKRGRRKRMPWL